MRFAPRDFRLLIGVHTHGQITPPFCQSLATLCGQLAAWCVAHRVLIVQDAFVTSGRDRLAAELLDSDCTHLLMLDADVEFAPQDVGALMAAGKDLAAGAYRRKEESGLFALSFLPGSLDGSPFDAQCRAVQVDGIGAGFMLVARRVFEDMAARMPELEYTNENGRGEGKRQWAFFEQVRDADGCRVSEDILFCRRWRALGGEVWALTDLRLRHWGPHAWEGSLADTIRLIDVAAE